MAVERCLGTLSKEPCDHVIDAIGKRHHQCQFCSKYPKDCWNCCQSDKEEEMATDCAYTIRHYVSLMLSIMHIIVTMMFIA